MTDLPLTSNDLNNTEMKYHGKYEHIIGQIQHISIMIRIGMFYTSYLQGTQNVAPTLPGLQGIKCCIQYLDSHPIKPILYPYDYYYV